MQPRNEDIARRFKIEKLEERIAPGRLTVSPPGIFNPDIDSVVSDAAKPGLPLTQAHTGGVITWSPGA
jgi:hypothetical protein